MLSGACDSLGQAQLVPYSVNLAVRLLQGLVCIVACLQPAQVTRCCVAALFGTSSDDGGADAPLCQQVICGASNTSTVSLRLILMNSTSTVIPQTEFVK